MVEQHVANVRTGVRFPVAAPIRLSSSVVERQFEELRVGSSILPSGTTILTGPLAGLGAALAMR